MNIERSERAEDREPDPPVREGTLDADAAASDLVHGQQTQPPPSEPEPGGSEASRAGVPRLEEPEAGPLLSFRVRHALVSWLGAFIVIAATWRLFEYQDLVFVFASLGGSAVIVFGMPESPMAQPRSLFGGHALASVVGLLFYGWFGPNTWSIAGAMATALLAMQLTRTVHSPAGADPIIIMTSAVSGPLVMLNLSVGLLVLWIVAVLLLNGLRISAYCRDVHRSLLGFVARSARRINLGLRRRGR